MTEDCCVCGLSVDLAEHVVWVHGPWTVSAEVMTEAMGRRDGSLPTSGSPEEEVAVRLANAAGASHDDHQATVRCGAALRDLGFEVWDGHRHCWDLDAYRSLPR
jgi:hypothetical protein